MTRAGHALTKQDWLAVHLAVRFALRHTKDDRMAGQLGEALSKLDRMHIHDLCAKVVTVACANCGTVMQRKAIYERRWERDGHLPSCSVTCRSAIRRRRIALLKARVAA